MSDTKELIIETTIAMIRKADGDPAKITIREISKEAGIAVSQINYHFQSKENLIAQCVQRMIQGIIGLFDGIYSELENLSAFDKLRHMANMTFSFLYENENLSRISILTDYQSSNLNDNTKSTIAVYYPLVKKVCEERNIENPRLITELLVLSLQSVFLRTDKIIEELGVNLRNSDERSRFIDNVLKQYFR